MLGMSGINRWSFPSASNAYLAGAADNGNMISSYNSPSSFMAVTLPPTTTLNPGWTIGVTGDNGKVMSVQVNGVAGGQILMPGLGGARASLSLSTLGNYESAVLQFDGSDFRVLSMTPFSADLLGNSIPTQTPTSSSAACQTGALVTDSNYLYFCTAPNTWKRVAWSSF
jgi:hypothetical protein